jgi:hypothetical protein
MEQTNVQSKISMSSLGINKKVIQEALKASKGKDVELASFLCLVTAHEDIPNKLDPKKVNTRFRGSFEGTNRLSGEEAMASQGFFPGIAEDFLKGLHGAAESGASRSGFIITAKENEKSPVGYIFGLSVLTDRKNADPFKDFRAALPAPAKKAK